MDVEQEIQAKGLTAPRITLSDIEAAIASEHYFTANDGVYGAGIEGDLPPPALRLLTFCVLLLKNGFTVTGESACVSAENFDAEIGRKVARDNAVQKIWPLMGYELKERLHRKQQALARGSSPLDELSDRMGRIYEFYRSAIFTALPISEQHLLLKQYAHMTGYLYALDRRIRLFTAFPAPPVAPTAPAPTT